jgi:predicted GNAT family N-acyltransferase
VLKTTSDQLKFIAYGSEEYNQAAQLRYRLFYQEHNIPFESIFDSQEEKYLHLAITACPSNYLLAYGQLGQNRFKEFQIYQMVVEPKYQGLGLGMCLLQVLCESSIERGGSLIFLNARVEKMPFYQKFGFESVGEIFASSMTGVPHIKMQKVLFSEIQQSNKSVQRNSEGNRKLVQQNGSTAFMSADDESAIAKTNNC